METGDLLQLNLVLYPLLAIASGILFQIKLKKLWLSLLVSFSVLIFTILITYKVFNELSIENSIEIVITAITHLAIITFSTLRVRSIYGLNKEKIRKSKLKSNSSNK